MRLSRLRLQWEALGREDPLWAVLSVSEKQHGRWDLEEFFATGRAEVSSLLQHVQSTGFPLPRRRALDFGCGVGRVTQALCAHFEACDGVDISASMLERARRYNRYPDRCRYHLNPTRHLRIFPDESFSLVHSHLVLQHVPPSYAKAYVREFLRVLEPGGLLVFHLPSHRFPGEFVDRSRRSICRAPLPELAFQARVSLFDEELSAPAGESVTIKARVENLSPVAWPAGGGRGAQYQVRVGNRWLDVAGSRILCEDSRAELPHDVPPGEHAEVFLTAHFPAHSGDYVLEVDLVQETIGWFGQRGSPPARMPCRALGSPGRDAHADRTEPAHASHPLARDALRDDPAGGHGGGFETAVRSTPSPVPVPFRVRHPRLHDLIRRLGVPQARGWLTEHIRRRRHLRPRPSSALAAMYGVPAPEVLWLIEQGGGRLLSRQEAELTRSGWQSYRYWVTKPSRD